MGENWTDKGMWSSVRDRNNANGKRMGMKYRGREERWNAGGEMNGVWREKKNEEKKKERQGR